MASDGKSVVQAQIIGETASAAQPLCENERLFSLPPFPEVIAKTLAFRKSGVLSFLSLPANTTTCE